MLSIRYGDMPEAIYNTSVYFKNTYLDSWFDDEFARRMIKSVDKAEVLGDALIQSRVLGKIAPTQLSGGAKRSCSSTSSQSLSSTRPPVATTAPGGYCASPQKRT